MSTSSASDVLARAANVYVSCRTYQDTGEVTAVLVTGARPWNRTTQKMRFRTVFSRPDRLLFEYRDVGLGPESEWNREVIWGGATSACSWSTLKPGVSSHKNITHAAGALAGVSHGVSASIPYMLFSAEPRYSCLPDPSTASVVGTGDVEGRACTKIEGILRGRRRAVAWIENASSLLLKLESEMVSDDESRMQQLKGMREHLAGMRPDDPHRSAVEKAVAHFSESRLTDHRTEYSTEWRPTLDQTVDPACLEFSLPTEGL